ncbi:MAG: hypothetical protein HY940_01120 [Gammaproteobacteria bacterium]|nr:hypothetical protein [Gammaproteobacteria bacterium]
MHLIETHIKTFIARCPLPPWLQRLSLYGFLFFLIKGLLWLVIPASLIMFNQ